MTIPSNYQLGAPRFTAKSLFRGDQLFDNQAGMSESILNKYRSIEPYIFRANR